MKERVVRGSLSIISLFFVMFARPYNSLFFCAIVTLFAFALFFYAICEVEDSRKRAFLGWLYFFLVQLYQLRWFSTTYYHGKAIIFIYVFMASLIAFCFALISVVIRPKKGLKISQIIAISAFWALLEHAKLHVFSGFPFNPLSLYTFCSPYFLQLASIFGALFLSFLVLCINLFAYNLLQQFSFKNFSLYTLSFSFPLLIGYGASHFSSQKSIGNVSALILQPGLLSEEKWDMEGFKGVRKELDEQIGWVVDQIKKSDPKKLDLVVLPEVAFSEDAYACILPLEKALNIVSIPLSRCAPLKKGLAKKVQGSWFVSCAWICHTLSNFYQLDIAAGLSDYNCKSHCSKNALFLFKKGSLSPECHVKRVLIPLTEYLPFSFLTSVMKTFGIEEFYEKGSIDSVLFASNFPVIPAICIEEGYSDCLKKSARKDGDIIISVSNDVWFPYSNLAQEHLYLSALRSLENGVCTIRSCNAGVSAFISEKGEILESLTELNQAGKMQKGSILICKELKKKETFFKKLPVGLDRIIFSFFVIFPFINRVITLRIGKKNSLL